DRRLNLYSYDLATRQTLQHTHFTDFDVKFPSLGAGLIVFEEAGYVWSFDIAAGSARRVPISVRDDFAASRDALINVAKFVETAAPAPDGKRVVFTARGATFTVPAKDGATRNLRRRSGVHERDAVWSPDGKWIAYDSDESGENELYVRAQDGSGEKVEVTSGADTYYCKPTWSPDSRKLLWADRLQRLRFVAVDTKAVTLVDTAAASEIRQYAWSPDSEWIAWSRPEEGSLARVWLYSLASGRKFAVTDGWYSATEPAFSDDGKFLLFSSRRDFRPVISDIEFDHVYKDLERVYMVALARDTESPLKPESDEVEIAPAAKAAGGAGAAKDAPARPVPVRVDEDGIGDRVIGLPVKPSNYATIRAVGARVYCLRDDAGATLGAQADAAARPKMLVLYSLKERKETELGEVASYEITADGKKMLVKAGSDYALIDLPTSKLEIKDKLSLEGLAMHLDRHAEWLQIYNECWRQMRDFFFSPTMNGVDWPAMRAKYAALLPFAQTRYDVTYLTGEMIAELHNSHTYVGDGDRPLAPRIATGLLGAELSRDPASRAYRIDRIIRGENWQEATRSPLTEIGVDVAEGDYILAVDGRRAADLANIYSALVGTVGKQVVLRVNSKPVDDGARSITVVPIADEAPLYYASWVRRNTDYVERKTGGQVGYLHIPDMSVEGLGEFAKRFYPQLTKRALIIDDRGNGGGNVSPMIIERLARELVLVQKVRNAATRPNPHDMQLGPKVVLMDEFSASDGDLFAYRFRTDGLGKLIGKRSWGGVVGYRAALPLVDGGYLYKPESAPYAKDGNDWPIEGHGVDPDIVVDNDPAKEFAGTDQQLDRAIEEVLVELKAGAKPLPPPPPWPDRS